MHDMSTGAIAKDGHFDFGSCMTHNYREKVCGFVEWVHTIADNRNRRDYRRRISDAETLSWWQSLGYEANTHCDYCVAVCPAGDEAASFLADRKQHFRDVVRPFREKPEMVYVVAHSDAEDHAATFFPHKTIRRIGSDRSPASVPAMLRMLPLRFQRGQAKGRRHAPISAFAARKSLKPRWSSTPGKSRSKPDLSGRQTWRSWPMETALGILARPDSPEGISPSAQRLRSLFSVVTR